MYFRKLSWKTTLKQGASSTWGVIAVTCSRLHAAVMTLLRTLLYRLRTFMRNAIDFLRAIVSCRHEATDTSSASEGLPKVETLTLRSAATAAIATQRWRSFRRNASTASGVGQAFDVLLDALKAIQPRRVETDSMTDIIQMEFSADGKHLAVVSYVMEVLVSLALG